MVTEAESRGLQRKLYKASSWAKSLPTYPLIFLSGKAIKHTGVIHPELPDEIHGIFRIWKARHQAESRSQQTYWETPLCNCMEDPGSGKVV